MNLSQNESTLNSAQILFENPVNDFLNIRLNPSTLAETSRVIDLQGRTVANCTFDREVSKVCCNMNVSHLRKGAYLLEIATQDGKLIRQKFLKN